MSFRSTIALSVVVPSLSVPTVAVSPMSVCTCGPTAVTSAPALGVTSVLPPTITGMRTRCSSTFGGG
eukprot:7073330-Pyramimonas_sp.AAC.2